MDSNTHHKRRKHTRIVGAAVAAVGVAATTAAWSGSAAGQNKPDTAALGHFKHLVVIYEENHSFDNLFGGWGAVDGAAVDGIGSAGYAEHATQTNRAGT